MGNIIEVKNLKKYFSTPRGTLHAVDNVFFTTEQRLLTCPKKNLRRNIVLIFR